MQAFRPLHLALFAVSTVILASSPVEACDRAAEIVAFEERAPAGHERGSWLVEIEVDAEGGEENDDEAASSRGRAGLRSTPIALPCLDSILLIAVGSAGPSPGSFLPIRASRGPPRAG